MSTTDRHFVRVTHHGGVVNNYAFPALANAEKFARDVFDAGFAGTVVCVFEGSPLDNVDRDPVLVLS